MESADDKIECAERMARTIGLVLKGADPIAQSVAIADALSLWVVGFRPDLREEALERLLRLVRDLIPINERQCFGEKGWHE